MTDTKEQILMTALRLFARDGYEAVSVSMIAGALGITKGALYRHYKNKRDIFDHIVERMFQLDAERSQTYQVPDRPFEAAPEAYRHVSAEHMRTFTLEQFRFWTEDDFASHFRKMLMLEQYRSEEMAALYSSCLTAGPAAYMEDVFREWMHAGVLRPGDPEQLALEYYAPLFLLIQIFDRTGDADACAALLSRHVEHFLRTHCAE